MFICSVNNLGTRFLSICYSTDLVDSFLITINSYYMYYHACKVKEIEGRKDIVLMYHKNDRFKFKLTTCRLLFALPE